MTGSILLLLALVAADPQAAPAADTPAKAANSGDKVICKKFLETGSLVKGTRVCKTKSEWERDRIEMRAQFTGGASSCRTNNGTSCF